jgi:hypothetical protein
MYPHRPLGKKALDMHWAKGTAKFLAPEFGMGLINSADAGHTRGIRDRRSVSSSLHLLNGVVVAWVEMQETVDSNATLDRMRNYIPHRRGQEDTSY